MITDWDAGDDSSNEDLGDEREGDGENKDVRIKKENKEEGGDGAGGEPEQPSAETLPEQSNGDTEEEEGGEEENKKEVKNKESEDFSFPDTTISLAHLQPSR